MNTPPAPSLITAEERAIALYQNIMGVSREAAEQAYMLVDTRRASVKVTWNQSYQPAYNQGSVPNVEARH